MGAPRAANFEVVLRKIKELSPSVKQLSFEMTNGKSLDFVPGQYIILFLPISELGENNKRYYSVASSPGSSTVELAITRVSEGAASRWLHSLDVGATIRALGPHGFFTLEDPPEADMCFVATGTGVAPIRPMIRRVFERGTSHQVTLVFGCRHEEDILYRVEWEALAKQHANFNFTPTLSRPPQGWPGHRGYVQEQLKRYFIDDRRTRTEVFVCGLNKMVGDVAAKLKEAGWDRKKIHREKYD